MMLMSVPTPPPPTQPGRYRNPWAWMVVVLSVVVVVLVVVVTVSLVGDSESDATLAPGAQPAPGEADGPPCFGLPHVGNLPGWAEFGGLGFGEEHDLGGGQIVDLRPLVGCEIPGGIVVVFGDGRFDHVYHDDCVQLVSMDIPVEELRPGPGQNWVCYQPFPGGGTQTDMLVFKQG